ncbi:hypothetical protein EI42_01498 [Thermosporothrix hazakensis]|jgi:hypothetical protein|uniref:Uncharacterized protein n=1 Tax=Thermosporothrix hazakensis TaxID=644383 RepID=A0A326UKN9_THEHA|nr:hypothetical protein [Thermosporothrix hazakensis]PZW32953.1 hypothetical protein EI42_01498 [Thermosporothrix hazakensis]GCE48985.1 hypothetical protein KTH_38540 [Thermosporothrix hazakensis]
MSNSATAALKVAALLGSAALGAFLARWFDHFLTTQVEKSVEYQPQSYELGLAPLEPTQPTENDQSQ